MHFRVSIVTIFFALILGACASKPDFSKGVSEQFTTGIHSDGSKRFEFVIARESRKGEGGRGEGKRGGNKGEGKRGQGNGGQGGRSQGQQRGGQQGGTDSNLIKEDFIALLDAKITETEYCRNGYIELDFSQMRGKTEFVGECQESASAEDKKRWD